MFPHSTSRQFIADIDEEAEEELLAWEYEELQAAVRKLPPVQFQDEVAQPLGHGVLSLGTLNFKVLLGMRRTHQTWSADKGVQTHHSQGEREDDKTKPTLLGSIIHHIRKNLMC
jgi:hypothetical protein